MYDQTMSSIDICLILFIITDESTTPLSTEIWLSTYVSCLHVHDHMKYGFRSIYTISVGAVMDMII
jgi:hypothetical protein